MKKKEKTLVINNTWCKGCRICVEFCPRHALAMNEYEKAELVSPENCNMCGLCELRCPDFAIEIEGV